jgi:hypothetical protein
MNSSENKKIIRQVIAVVASVFLVWLIYFGSYLPLQKSKKFIATLQSMDQMRSVQEVEQAYDIPFSIPSPIGQEEIVRHFSGVILSTIQRFGPERASTTAELVKYVTDNFQPIMSRQRGMSFNQNLYILGSLNEIAFVQTKNPTYLADAQKYYSLGHELAPKRPQFLYGLFDLYRIEKNIPKTTEIADQILTLWPTDTKTKSLLGDFLSKVGTATTTKTVR